MAITEIKRVGNSNTFHVYADGSWLGVFLDEIIVLHGIKVGAEFDDAQFKEIKKENDEKVSFELAVSYLEKYNVSEKGISDYLKKKGFEKQTIEKCKEKLREYGLLDDEKFAKNYFDSLSASKGKRAISQKLLQKGVSKEIVDELISGVDEDDEFEKALVLGEKFAKNREKTPKNKQKCLAHLVYKGYDYSVAKKVTDKVFGGDANDWL